MKVKKTTIIIVQLVERHFFYDRLPKLVPSANVCCSG